MPRSPSRPSSVIAGLAKEKASPVQVRSIATDATVNPTATLGLEPPTRHARHCVQHTGRRLESGCQAIHKSQHIISAAGGLPVVELPSIHHVCSYEARILFEIWLPTLKGKLFKPVSLVMPHFSRVRHHTTGRRRTVLLLLARAKRALRFRHTCQKQSWNFGMGYTAKKVLVFALSR